MPRTKDLPAVIGKLSNADAASAAALRTSLGNTIVRGLRSLQADNGMYDPVQVQAMAEKFAAASAAAERKRAAVAAKSTSLMLAQMGERVRVVSADVSDLRGGVDPAEVWSRPMKEYRYQVSLGKSPADALQAAIDRAHVIGGDNLLLANRKAAQDVLQQLSKVIGYRRVIHPEMSKGGSCGLCIAASDRKYRVEDLMPIHANCECTVAPIFKGSDPGDTLNGVDLAQLYKDAGNTTDAAKLKFTRYQVNDHGELGPVLVKKGANFRDTSDVQADLGKPKAETPVNLAAKTRDQAVVELQNLLRTDPTNKDAIKAKKAEISRLNRAAA